MRGEEHGPTWPNLSRLGVDLAALGILLGRTRANLANLSPTCVQHGATWALLAHGSIRTDRIMEMKKVRAPQVSEKVRPRKKRSNRADETDQDWSTSKIKFKKKDDTNVYKSP